METTERLVTFKKRGYVASQRKRNLSHESSDEEHSMEASCSTISKLKKTAKNNAFIQTTSKNKLNQKASVRHSDSESSDEDAKSSFQLGISYQAKRSEERSGPKDMGATATLEIETEHDKDAQAQFERLQTVTKELKGKEDDKTYRGKGAYGQFFEKKDTAIGNASSGLNRKGPIRAPNFVRQSVRWDYQPDICKDYKETGFCGFGDSCKFLHDRSDYKHGWEIEREYNEGRYGKNDEDPHQFEISDEENALPFKCVICRNSFVQPVVTKCKHYFCEKCALDNFQKTHKCFVCSKGTGGIFTPAKDVIIKMKGEALKRANIKSSGDESDSSSDRETEVAKLDQPAEDENVSNGSDSEEDIQNDEDNE